MKMLLFIVSVFVLLGTASCKKEYTCYCQNASTGAGTNPTVKASNASTATAECTALGSGTTLNNIVTCTLE